MTAARIEALLAALNDARDVFSIVYMQLSDLDAPMDGVGRSMAAANELAEAARRIDAVLGGDAPDSIYTDVNDLRREVAQLEAALAEAHYQIAGYASALAEANAR